jgi:hypothetical protein
MSMRRLTDENLARLRAAIDAGASQYVSTKACRRGHFTRYLSGNCVECDLASKRRNYVPTGRPRGRPRKVRE